MTQRGARPDPRRVANVFGLLVLAQAAHSVEEYGGRLWDVFPPARFVTGLIGQDREQGFLILNVAIVAFGAWCYALPMRRGWPSARALAWAFVTLELINGTGHLYWSLSTGGYTPGVITAPMLILLGLWAARELSVTGTAA